MATQNWPQTCSQTGQLLKHNFTSVEPFDVVQLKRHKTNHVLKYIYMTPFHVVQLNGHKTDRRHKADQPGQRWMDPDT